MTPVLANILQPLIDIFKPVLEFFHDSVGLSWGWSIVALTVTIRALLLPLTLKQVKSMRGLQLIAPEMKKVQEKYKDDKQRQQQEMMKLYSEHKVNPFASCLPLLAQLPVFIALFYMLQDDLRTEICGQSARPCGESAESGFLFIPDITDEASGAVLITLLILYVGSQLLSSLLMSVSADKNQRRIFMALPFFFVPFIINFPAGLLVYWITTNVWTIVQQFIVRRTVGPVVKPEEAEEALAKRRAEIEAKGGGKGGGRFAKAIQAASAGASAGGGTTAEAGNGSNGGGKATGSSSMAKAAAGAGAGAPRRSSAPPPPPKRKKKRSGRRR